VIIWFVWGRARREKTLLGAKVFSPLADWSSPDPLPRCVGQAPPPTR
jgi:hypothetical protein